MKALALKIKPSGGFSQILHLVLTAILPLLIFILARIRFFQLGLALILLSKWRMFAVRPRYWLANIRANAIDIVVGAAVLVFMAHSVTAAWQLVWALVYGAWLILLKPGNSVLKVSLQALVGQTMGLMAVFLMWGGTPLYVLILLSWLICYLAARHFFTSFDEPYSSLYAHSWGYFGAALTWVLGHWLLFYGVIAQPVLLLTVIGFGLTALYYLEQADRLSTLLRRQFVFIMVAIVIVVLVFSDWSSKVV